MLKQVTKGKVRRPLNVMVYGVEGVGKTTFASKAPKPIFLGAEVGSELHDVDRFPQVKTWSQVETAMRELLDENHDYKTLVIDTIDSLEPILWEKIKRDSSVNSIEKACGGYGKGYTRAMEKMQEFTHALDLLRSKGINIITLAHCAVVKFNDPIAGIEYDRYVLKLHKKTSSVFMEWCDALLFTNYKSFVATNEKTQKDRAIGDGARVIYSEKRPAFDAKNRYCLPSEIALDYGELSAHVEMFYKDFKTDDLVKILIEKTNTLDENLRPKILEYIEQNNSDMVKLLLTEERINQLMGE